MWKGGDCEIVPDGEPLLQGDLLKRFIGGTEDSLCVVISADCDIAQGKLGEAGVACVDLRPLKSYLLDEHLSRVIARQSESRHRELTEWIKKHWEAGPQPRSRLTDQAITEWVHTGTASEIAAALGVTERDATRYLEGLVSGLRLARDSLSRSDNPKYKLQSLARLQKGSPPKDWRQFVQSQLTKLQSHQLPEDLFFLTTIPSESALGYVAKLRNIKFVSIANIAENIPAARESASAHVRIARLTSTFKHGLAQQVGYLFSRIGYPLGYEAERSEIFDLITEELCSELGAGND
jgi:hypothetical protein